MGLTCGDRGLELPDRPGTWALGPPPPEEPSGAGLAEGGPHLGNEDALICGITGVPCMALGAASNADAQPLPGGLLDTELPHARGRGVPPHEQDQLQAGPKQGTDRLLVRGLPNVLPVHCQDAVPNPKAAACSQAPWEHLSGEDDVPRAGGLAAPCPGWALLARGRPRGLLYLGDEHARLLDTKRVAGVIGAPNDAEPQRAPGSRQADLLGIPRGWLE